MTQTNMENYGKSFLVIIAPISFLIIVVLNTWKFLLIGLLLMMSLHLWQKYRWEKWCDQVNPLFYELIEENQGKISSVDLAIRGNFPGDDAKRYLEKKAKEFGTNPVDSETDSPYYYFITGSILGEILDGSESDMKPVGRAVTKEARSLLSPPVVVLEGKEGDKEGQITNRLETKSLEKQLAFGSLIQSELAQRLGVYSSTVYKRRNDPDFSEWTRSRDPDGIAWSYSRKNREFFPMDK